MRLDYSEKRSVREGAERKPVTKNRPRKESAALYALKSAFLLLVTFSAGGVAVWFAYKATHPTPAPVVALPSKKEEPAPVAPKPAADAPLTFYNTLPAGGKPVIGSGLNPKKTKPAATAPHPAAAVAAPTAADPVAAELEEKVESSGRFVVQLASYRDQREADRAQTKLAGKGVAAYVLESRLQDNTVWYRVRVGRHLSKAEAEELAAKSGKGAVVLKE